MFENIFSSVNIALVNEMKVICDSLDVDVNEVVEAANTKPYGFMKFVPGPGVGGHCIKPDPYYLSWAAQKAGVVTKFINLAGEINDSMPIWVFNKIQSTLNENNKCVNNSKILALGLSYKKNVNDTRESPSIDVVNLLLKNGATVDAFDPVIGFKVFPEIPYEKFNLVVSAEQLDLRSYDAVVILTDHDEVVKYLYGSQSDRIITPVIDTRNCINRERIINHERIIKA